MVGFFVALHFADMTFPQIIKDIRQKQFKPIYFLMGDEPYYIDKICDELEKHVLTEEEKSFNQSILYGHDVKLKDVVGEAKRYPMMAERVLVVVKEAQHLGNKWDDLEAYAAAPLDTTVLVFAVKGKKLDKRTRTYKNISNQGVIFESKKEYENKIPDWIGRNLNARGYKTTPKAVQLLAESLGNDLNRIDNELAKLEVIVPKNTVIDDTVVEENIGISKDYNNFELINALRDKNLKKAIKIQKYFAADPRHHPLVLTLGLLFNYFAKLMILHQAKDKSPNGLASVLKVGPYFVKDYQAGAQNYNLKKLGRIIGYIKECDYKSKGIGAAPTPESELLKELIFKIVYA